MREMAFQHWIALPLMSLFCTQHLWAEEVTLMAVGDVLMHFRVQQVGGKDHRKLYRHIRETLSEADIAFANLETPIAKKDYKGRREFILNAPESTLEGLKWAGFDLLSVANNHALDQGLEGLQDTLQAIKKYDLSLIGAGHDRKTAEKGLIMEIRGIRLGFLAQSQFVNSHEKVVNRHPKKFWLNVGQDLSSLSRRISDLKQDCDFVIVSMHWGREYQIQPDKYQKKAAYQLVQAGADLILGHHPHVLQPIEEIETQSGFKGHVIYSLGNFISNQQRHLNDPEENLQVAARNRESAILKVVFKKDEEVRSIKAVSYYPLWTRNESRITLSRESPTPRHSRHGKKEEVVAPQLLKDLVKASSSKIQQLNTLDFVVEGQDHQESLKALESRLKFYQERLNSIESVLGAPSNLKQ